MNVNTRSERRSMIKIQPLTTRDLPKVSKTIIFTLILSQFVDAPLTELRNFWLFCTALRNSGHTDNLFIYLAGPLIGYLFPGKSPSNGQRYLVSEDFVGWTAI